jgi:hypothetical protein
MLAEAGYRCYKNGTLCTEPVNNPTPQSVALSAGVGIYSISTELNYLRQYMIDADGYIAQVEYDPYSGWHAANRINDELKAHRASPIAAGMVGGEIWLFWFDDFKNLKTTTSVYKSSTWTERTFQHY